jgi:phage-related holin
MIPTWLKNITYVIAALIGVEHGVVEAFACLLVFDVITGVAASAKIDGWRSVTSHRLGFGVLAKLLFILVPVSIALAGVVIGQNLQVIVSSSLSVLALSEAYSVIANLYAIHYGKRVPEFDALSIVLRNIFNMLESLSKSKSMEEER